ncbi:MAG: hypothetical protein GTN78_03725, partial [Gemmatimonadales bacterium]|nr:hypothetical protein [Gemmatimonadales bacterium]
MGYSLAVLLVVAIAASSSREARSLSLEIEAAVLTAAVATAAVWMLSATPKVRSLRLFATLAGHMYVPQLL